MTMDMALALAAPAANAPAQQPTAGGQETFADARPGQFTRMLVARVSDAGGAARSNAQQQNVLPIAWKLSGGEWANLAGGSTGASLFDKLDELLRLLEDGSGPLVPSQQQEEVDAVLRELEAIMMALFGIPLPIAGTGQASQSSAQTSGTDSDAIASDAELSDGLASRGGLLETMAFLRSFLSEGAFRPLSRKENAIFESLIGRLQRALTATDEQTLQNDGTGGERLPDIRTTGFETRTSVETLLARLAGQPMQASVAAALTEAQKPGVAQDAAGSATQAGTATTSPALMQTAQPQMAPSGEAVQAAAADSGDLIPVAQSVQPVSAGVAAETARTEATVRQPVPSVPVERFHELISGMAVKQMKLSASNGVSEARILLVPEHLGEVAVRITLQNGQLTAQFVTESAVARELIENQFVLLRGVLQNQGIQVDRLEVTQGSATAQSQLFQEQRQRGGQDRQEDGRGKREKESVTVFESELLEQSAIRELGYGRAINVKA